MSVSRWTLYRWRQNGLPFIRTGQKGGRVLYRESDLRDWAGRLVQAHPPSARNELADLRSRLAVAVASWEAMAPESPVAAGPAPNSDFTPRGGDVGRSR